MPPCTQLPRIDNVPEFIYNITPVPTSVKEAKDIIEKLKIEVTDIIEQLKINKVSDAIDAFDDSEYVSLTWQRKAHYAKRVKLRQIGLLKLWIRYNNPETLSKEELALRQEANRKKKERAEILRRENQANQEQVEIEQQVFGIEGRKIINSLKREIKWLRMNFAEVNKIFISLLTEIAPVEYEEAITYLHDINSKVLNLDEIARQGKLGEIGQHEELSDCTLPQS